MDHIMDYDTAVAELYKIAKTYNKKKKTNPDALKTIAAITYALRAMDCLNSIFHGALMDAYHNGFEHGFDEGIKAKPLEI